MMLRLRTAARCAIPVATFAMAMILVRPASAVDGVIELSQASASGGFPIVITEPGSYVLTSELSVTGAATPENTTAIEIQTSGVVLDLNGFAIQGPAVSGSGIGVLGKDSDITVRNGSVIGMGDDGVQLGDYSRVEALRASTNGGDGIVLNNWGVVMRSQALGNGGSGISVSLGCSVVSNVANENETGIFLGTGSLALGNVANGNTLVGIFAPTGVHGLNALTDNNGGGAQINGSTRVACNLEGTGTVVCPP